jgi:hypothetical protein
MKDDERFGVYCDAVVQGCTPEPHGMIVGVLPEYHDLWFTWLDSERVVRYACSCEQWHHDLTYEAYMTENARRKIIALHAAHVASVNRPAV